MDLMPDGIHWDPIQQGLVNKDGYVIKLKSKKHKAFASLGLCKALPGPRLFETGQVHIFQFLPIPGYNSTTYYVRADLGDCGIIATACTCQGAGTFGRCTHQEYVHIITEHIVTDCGAWSWKPAEAGD